MYENDLMDIANDLKAMQSVKRQKKDKKKRFNNMQKQQFHEAQMLQSEGKVKQMNELEQNEHENWPQSQGEELNEEQAKRSNFDLQKEAFNFNEWDFPLSMD